MHYGKFAAERYFTIVHVSYVVFAGLITLRKPKLTKLTVEHGDFYFFLFFFYFLFRHKLTVEHGDLG